jgi:glucarate dehydratase
MKITKVTATPITLSMTRAAATSMGSGSAVTRTVVEIDTDEGLVGLGETGGAHAAQIIRERFGPRITGLDPRDRQSIRRRCVPLIMDYGTVEQPVQLAAFAGIEIALWDILGRAANLPVYKLLGGAVRPRAPFAAYAFSVDLTDGYSQSDVPSLMAKIAGEEVTRTGAGLFEFKIARHSVSTDIDTVRAVRAALGPDIEIGVDANMRYSPAQARYFLEAVRDARLCNIEEPCATLTECARLSRDFRIPVSTHCMDFDALGAYPDISGIVGGVDAQGGIARIVELAGAATLLGRQFWLRSCVESGIAWAAMVHLGIACPALERPSQALMQWIEDDLIEGEPWVVRDGGVVPPDRPGLGVEIDREAFDRMAGVFMRDGERTYFDQE